MAITRTYFATSSSTANVADSDYIVVQQGTGADTLEEMKKATVKDLREPLYQAIENASLASLGGTGKYISSISQSSGVVSATETEFADNVVLGAQVPPKSIAVVNYITDSSTNDNGTIHKAIASAVNALNVNSLGETGSYIKLISEVKGKIEAVPQAFDTGITNNSGNAPTSKAVKDYVDSNINALDGSIGNTNTLVKSVTEANGVISGEAISLDNTINGTGVPTSPAVKAAIDALDGSVGDSNTLIKSITEIDGKIT